MWKLSNKLQFRLIQLNSTIMQRCDGDFIKGLGELLNNVNSELARLMKSPSLDKDKAEQLGDSYDFEALGKRSEEYFDKLFFGEDENEEKVLE